MEENFLNDIERDFSQNGPLGSRKEDVSMWYNEDGDCIQFQTEQIAVIAKRVDEYLTIYHSAENNKPIGFQVKDVKALVNKYECDGISVEASVTNEMLISVTALLLKAYGKLQPTINRLQGYSKAMNVPRPIDQVPIPA